jgi:hypothetical protein
MIMRNLGGSLLEVEVDRYSSILFNASDRLGAFSCKNKLRIN